MDVTFLGTGSAYPSPTRGASCIVFRNEGYYWMFDCGEGSQIQLMRSHIRAGRIGKIFITHLHGDHLFGLPGLLCTIGMNQPERSNMDIYGPQGLRKYLRTSLELSRAMLGYNYAVHELLPPSDMYAEDFKDWPVDHTARGALHPNEIQGRDIQHGEDNIWHVFNDDVMSVKASWLTHRVPAIGYVIEELTLPGKLDPSILKRKGVPPGPLYSKIKNGESITTPTGEVIHPDDVLGPPILGRKVAILQDTSNSDRMEPLAQNVTALIHEATLENEMVVNAIEKGHSTPKMAAVFAKRVNADQLILTHFSQRYRPAPPDSSTDQTKGDDTDSVMRLLQQAVEEFGPNVTVAQDLLTVPILRRK